MTVTFRGGRWAKVESRNLEKVIVMSLGQAKTEPAIAINGPSCELPPQFLRLLHTHIFPLLFIIDNGGHTKHILQQPITTTILFKPHSPTTAFIQLYRELTS
jgi:hypothetical protein